MSQKLLRLQSSNQKIRLQKNELSSLSLVNLESWGGRQNKGKDLALGRCWQQRTAFLLSFSCPLRAALRCGWKSNVSLLIFKLFPHDHWIKRCAALSHRALFTVEFTETNSYDMLLLFITLSHCLWVTWCCVVWGLGGETLCSVQRFQAFLLHCPCHWWRY